VLQSPAGNLGNNTMVRVFLDGGGQMHKHWACAMGHTVHADSDDELVSKAQEHMKKEHGTDITREDVLKDAHEGSH
jgi:predicted small metal-binding protein